LLVIGAAPLGLVEASPVVGIIALGWMLERPLRRERLGAEIAGVGEEVRGEDV
jgi:hypothetical protein